MKDLFNEIYKTLMRENEDRQTDRHTHTPLPCSWIETINIVKMSILFKAIYRFSTSPIKITMAFFTKPEEINPKIHMEVTTPIFHKLFPSKIL
jgi:hypothetical protein